MSLEKSRASGKIAGMNAPAPSVPAKRGRPSKYRPELVDEIVCDISHGITLAEICRRDHMPDRDTVYDWLERDEDFSRRFARAREIGFDAISEECKAIADDGSLDYIQTEDGPVFNAEHVQRSKLRVDTRLKLLAKWSPRFADRQVVTGADGGAVQVEHRQVVDLSKLDDDQRAALREILEAARANAAVDVTPGGGE